MALGWREHRNMAGSPPRCHQGRPHHFKASDSLPEVHQPDFLLCLSRRAYLRYAKTLAANGAMIAKEEMSDSPQGTYLPLRTTALSLRGELYANIIGLGTLAAPSRAVAKESLKS